MRIIIVGASGTIGRSLYALAQASQQKVIGTCHRHEMPGLIQYDMCKEQLGSVVPQLGSNDVVYILSAYTNVAWVHDHQEQAYALNVLATKKLIDELAVVGARIIFTSSVEVFDGEQGNYNEKSSPNPLTAYGRMKMEVEDYLAKKECKHCIVRGGWNVSWDFDSHCVVKLTYKTLISPGAKMAQDNVFTIADVRDTCGGLLKLARKPEVRVCHLGSKPPLVRAQLASMIMKFSKYKETMSYETVLFSEIPYSEKRSRDTHLDSSIAVSSLGMEFRSPEDIIRQKVELLDHHKEKI